MKPKLYNIDRIGTNEIGYLCVLEGSRNLPFEIKRVFWINNTPEHLIRGQHAHKYVHQFLIAVNGVINIDLIDQNKICSSYSLSSPSIGLYVPPFNWGRIKFLNNAVLLCLASDYYDENDYIRNFDEFIKYKNEI